MTLKILQWQDRPFQSIQDYGTKSGYPRETSMSKGRET